MRIAAEAGAPGYRGRVTSYDDDLRLAHVLADAIERTALDLFGSPDLEVQAGPEGSVVTPATARLEELVRHHLQRTRPRDRVEGRWLPPTGQGDRCWTIDVVDGVANYVRGVPVWATLISLVVGDRPVLGLVAAPSLARRWWAGSGTGAWTGRTLSRARQVQVSDVSVLAHGSVSADDVETWTRGPHAAGFGHLAARAWRTRAFGDFWSHALVAEGATDLGLSARADLLQLAALLPLVQEAGGRVTDPFGAPVELPQLGGGRAVVSSNGHFHDEVVQLLGALPDAAG